jgi:hypothetical protein
MRFYAPAIALALAASPALAQTQNPASPPGALPSALAPSVPPSSVAAPAGTPAPAAMSPANRSAPQAKRLPLKERFEAANATHDGHLTLEQAQAGLPNVARHFSTIDKDKKGYVTLDEIRHYYAQSFARQHRMNQASVRSGSGATTTQ